MIDFESGGRRKRLQATTGHSKTELSKRRWSLEKFAQVHQTAKSGRMSPDKAAAQPLPKVGPRLIGLPHPLTGSNLAALPIKI
jgi:hypothetical protein